MAGEDICRPVATLPSSAQLIAVRGGWRRQNAVHQFHRGAREIWRDRIPGDGQSRAKSKGLRRLATSARGDDFGGSPFCAHRKKWQPVRKRKPSEFGSMITFEPGIYV
jgi:hypothetical protein